MNDELKKKVVDLVVMCMGVLLCIRTYRTVPMPKETTQYGRIS